jgi:tetratricopeptide (TPR) repeat protein
LNAYVCHALSNLEIRLRNFEGAKSVLEQVVWQKPTSAICVSLADLERQLGNPDKAKQVLKHGLKRCTTERSKLLLALAWLEEDSFRNIPQALLLIKEALLDDPRNVKVYIAKVNNYYYNYCNYIYHLY